MQLPNVTAARVITNNFFPGGGAAQKQDYLHIKQASNGQIIGWIDENGIPQGSLAQGGSAPTSPGGVNQQIQFNDNGVFNGADGFTYVDAGSGQPVVQLTSTQGFINFAATLATTTIEVQDSNANNVAIHPTQIILTDAVSGATITSDVTAPSTTWDDGAGNTFVIGGSSNPSAVFTTVAPFIPALQVQSIVENNPVASFTGTSSGNGGLVLDVTGTVDDNAGSSAGFSVIEASLNSTGTNIAGAILHVIDTQVDIQSSGGTAAELAGIHIDSNVLGGQTVTNNYGLLIEAQDSTNVTNAAALHIVNQTGSTKAIQTGTGLVSFGGTFAIPAATAPSTATSAGTTGQLAWDGTHFYVCVATNTWVRATTATF